MEWKIIEKSGFTIVGKGITVSTEHGQNQQDIPAFWKKCEEDGTNTRLSGLGDNPLLGVCLDMNHETQQFTYMIGIETTDASADFEKRDIPAATWAVFPSVGPMPHAIQEVWEFIFREWLPSADYTYHGGVQMEVYFDGNTMAEDYYCEVWIPVVQKES